MLLCGNLIKIFVTLIVPIRPPPPPHSRRCEGSRDTISGHRTRNATAKQALNLHRSVHRENRNFTKSRFHEMLANRGQFDLCPPHLHILPDHINWSSALEKKEVLFSQQFWKKEGENGAECQNLSKFFVTLQIAIDIWQIISIGNQYPSLPDGKMDG